MKKILKTETYEIKKMTEDNKTSRKILINPKYCIKENISMANEMEEKKPHDIHLPFTKDLFNFAIWILIEILLSIGCWFFTVNYNYFGLTCSNEGDCYNGITFLFYGSLTVSTICFLSYYGVLEWIDKNTPRFRFVFK